jgi:hypothetical protein
VAVSNILAEIDREIAQLQHARTLLTGVPAPAVKRPVGRPPKAATLPPVKVGKKKKRNISPEGRKRIAEAVKRRWAEAKKASGK